MKTNILGKKEVWTCIFLILCSLGHVGEAVVDIAPLKMEQGKFLVASIPQFESGMDAKYLGEYNQRFRQIVLTPFNKFEAVALATRERTELPGHMKNALTFYADYEIFRNDLRFVSLTQKIYQYTGGAHGNSWLTASTIHLQSGKSLQLADLFIGGADFATRLSETVRREGAARKLPLWGFKGIGPDSSFYLTDEGIVLFFQPYEIAPYSEGIVRILVPYGHISDIMRPEAGI